MPKEATTMDGRKHSKRVWLSEIHPVWIEYVKEHPQHYRFAPIPEFEPKRRG